MENSKTKNTDKDASFSNTQPKRMQPHRKYISYVPGRKSPWCVTTYADKTRKRRFRKTEAEAIRLCNEIQAEKKLHGVRSMFFSPEERAEYLSAKELLESSNRNISVIEAVRAFEENLRKYEAKQQELNLEFKKKSFTQALNAYLESKIAAGRRHHTIREIQSRVGHFCDRFRDVHPADLTAKDVEMYCVRDGVSARTCKNDFSAIAAFLNFCVRRGFIPEMLKFETKAFLPRILSKQKTVFSLDDVKRLFDALKTTEKRRSYIPFYALQFFCGIRRTEAGRMRWEWIDCDKKEIRLPAEITKTGEEHILRAPMLPDTVFHWLKAYRTADSGLITSPSTRADNKLGAEIGWKRNVARHTFCTMHVSLHGDPAKTALLLRHRGQNRLWNNYLARLVPESEAQEYFNYTP